LLAYSSLRIPWVVTDIWQKLSSVEHNDIIIVTYYWQLLSQIIGETFYLVY